MRRPRPPNTATPPDSSEPLVIDAETLVTVTFADLGTRTRLTLRHTAFETNAARLNHQGGWTGALERLATFISTDGAAP